MNEKVSMVLRILFGLFIITFGLNKFLGFMPFPPIPGDGGELMRIYATSGFLKLIGALEILGGLALIFNKFVPLALTILAAIMFNAVAFHLLHDPASSPAAIVGLILALVLIFGNKSRFLQILSS